MAAMAAVTVLKNQMRYFFGLISKLEIDEGAEIGQSEQSGNGKNTEGDGAQDAGLPGQAANIAYLNGIGRGLQGRPHAPGDFHAVGRGPGQQAQQEERRNRQRRKANEIGRAAE